MSFEYLIIFCNLNVSFIRKDPICLNMRRNKMCNQDTIIINFLYKSEITCFSIVLNPKNSYVSFNQAFTNCIQGYDHARNVHANSVTCTLKFVRAIDSCLKIIWIFQCLFFATCLVTSFSYPAHCHTHSLAVLHCTDVFVCFHRSQICSTTMNYTSPSQSECWFPFILICRRWNIIKLICWV